MELLTDNAGLAAVTAALSAAALLWGRRGDLLAMLPSRTETSKADESHFLCDDYAAIQRLKARAVRLPNRAIATACNVIEDEFLVVDPVEDAFETV